MGAISFHSHDHRLHVDQATPVYWFGQHELAPGSLFSFDGRHVTLRAANGTWVWKLTGKEKTETYQGVRVRVVEGIWPD